MTKVKPLGNRVLVKRHEAKESSGGIILPDAAQEKPKEGEIIATGPGKMDDNGKVVPLDVKVGDRVLFGAYAGTEVEEDKLLIMTEDEILAVVE